MHAHVHWGGVGVLGGRAPGGGIGGPSYCVEGFLHNMVCVSVPGLCKVVFSSIAGGGSGSRRAAADHLACMYNTGHCKYIWGNALVVASYGRMLQALCCLSTWHYEHLAGRAALFLSPLSVCT